MDQVAITIKQFIEEIMGASLDSVIVSIVSTLVLLLFIKKFFWNNITDMLDKRDAAIKESIANAKKLETESEALFASANEAVSNSKALAKDILDKANVSAEKSTAAMLDKANMEIMHKKKYADLEIELEVAKSRDDIKDAIKDVAFAAAEKIIEKEIDKDSHKDVIEEAVKKVGV